MAARKNANDEGVDMTPSSSTLTTVLEKLTARIAQLELATQMAKPDREYVPYYDMGNYDDTTEVGNEANHKLSQIHCETCNCEINNSSKTEAPRWYAVTRGLQVGVFEGWHIVQPLVSRVSGSCFLRHPTRAAAEVAFTEAQRANSVKKLSV